jgi:predicted DsbA family dithiol-disulfide isomerase
LKRALFAAYFARQRNPSDHDVLIDSAAAAGLDPKVAGDVVSSGRYSTAVRMDEQRWRQRGVRGVPYVVIDDRHVIAGSQSPEQYERVLRQIASAMASPTHPRIPG